MMSFAQSTSGLNNLQQTWNQSENVDPNLNLNIEEEGSEKILKTDSFDKPLYKEEFIETSKENYIGPPFSSSKSISTNSNTQDKSSLMKMLEKVKFIKVENAPIKSYETPEKILRNKVWEIITKKSYEGKDKEAWEELCKIESSLQEQFPKLSYEDQFDLSILIAAINCLGQRNNAADEMLQVAEKYNSNFFAEKPLRTVCENVESAWRFGGPKRQLRYFRKDKEGQEALADAEAWNHSNRGQYWLKMGDFKQAEGHYKEALALRTNLQNMRLMSLALCNLANLYMEWWKLDEAEECAKSCMECIDDFNKDFYLKGKLMCIQAKIYDKRNKRVEAAELHKQGLGILKTRLAPDNNLSIEYEKIEY